MAAVTIRLRQNIKNIVSLRDVRLPVISILSHVLNVYFGLAVNRDDYKINKI